MSAPPRTRTRAQSNGVHNAPTTPVPCRAATTNALPPPRHSGFSGAAPENIDAIWA